ncbi:MAG: hypothetical protein WCI67_08975 [Chloroflexales bacterium]
MTDTPVSQPTRQPVAAMPVDPRIGPLVESLSDAQAEHVLRQMSAAWSPDEETDFLIGSPASNRATIAETTVMNMASASSPASGSSPEAEFATLEGFVAIAIAAV